MKKVTVSIIKEVVGLGTGFGTQIILSSLVKTFVRMPVNPILKGCVGVATWAIAGAVGKQAIKYTDGVIDEGVIILEMVTKKVEEQRKA